MIFGVVVTAALTLLAAWVVSTLVNLVRREIAISKLPGPEMTFFKTKGVSKDLKVHTQNLLKWVKEYPRCFRIRYFPTMETILVVHPEEARKVLTHHPKSYFWRKTQVWLTRYGVVAANGEDWRHARKATSPAFHKNILKSYCDITNHFSKELVDEWVKRDPNESMDVPHVLSTFTLNVFATCAFGFKEGQAISNERFQEACETIVNLMFDRIFHPHYKYDFIYFRLEPGKKMRAAVDYTHKLANEVIQKRRKELEGKSLEDVGKDVGAHRRMYDFLDILLLQKGENALCEESVLGQVCTFMFAGMDTTSTALSYSLFEFSRHPEWQKKIREEILENIGYTEDPVADDLKNLTMLTAFVKETMRRHPPVTVLARELGEDTEINGVLVPKGQTISVQVLAMNHNPALWDEPFKFDPERFMPGNQPKDSFTFVPFSAGERNCLGQHFAMNEIRITLVHILRRLEILPVENFELDPLVYPVLQSATGVKIRVGKLNND